MARPQVPAEVRFALHDTLFAYAWALDRAAAEGVAATFTRDGAVTNIAGRTWRGKDGVIEFAVQAFEQPGFKGRQHHVQPLFIEPAGDGWAVTSYWMAVNWDAGRMPVIVSMGWYRDTFALQDGTWLFAEKVISRWDSETAPMANEG
jgi:uncharacterized protein (TIGR02246 family)